MQPIKQYTTTTTTSWTERREERWRRVLIHDGTLRRVNTAAPSSSSSSSSSSSNCQLCVCVIIINSNDREENHTHLTRYGIHNAPPHPVSLSLSRARQALANNNTKRRRRRRRRRRKMQQKQLEEEEVNCCSNFFLSIVLGLVRLDRHYEQSSTDSTTSNAHPLEPPPPPALLFLSPHPLFFVSKVQISIWNLNAQADLTTKLRASTVPTVRVYVLFLFHDFTMRKVGCPSSIGGWYNKMDWFHRVTSHRQVKLDLEKWGVIWRSSRLLTPINFDLRNLQSAKKKHQQSKIIIANAGR